MLSIVVWLGPPEAETNKECVISGELDLKLLRKKRKRGVATTLKDRRPEIYEI